MGHRTGGPAARRRKLVEPYTERMQGLERKFQDRSGLTERRYYKLFYSHLHPFPLLVLGHNPVAKLMAPTSTPPTVTTKPGSTTTYASVNHQVTRWRVPCASSWPGA